MVFPPIGYPPRGDRVSLNKKDRIVALRLRSGLKRDLAGFSGLHEIVLVPTVSASGDIIDWL